MLKTELQTMIDDYNTKIPDLHKRDRRVGWLQDYANAVVSPTLSYLGFEQWFKSNKKLEEFSYEHYFNKKFWLDQNNPAADLFRQFKIDVSYGPEVRRLSLSTISNNEEKKDFVQSPSGQSPSPQSPSFQTSSRLRSYSESATASSPLHLPLHLQLIRELSLRTVVEKDKSDTQENTTTTPSATNNSP